MCEGQVDGSGELVVIGGGEGIAYQRKEKHYSRKKTARENTFSVTAFKRK